MIRVFRDGRRLARAAARYVVQIGNRSVTDRGKFELVLSGGKTPCETYKALAGVTQDDCRFWEHAHLFWGDERWVPKHREASNYRMARLCLLDFVKIPRAQIHRIQTHVSTPQEAAAQYEKIFPLNPDLLLLGVGEDGHTASLLPNSPALSGARRGFVAVEGPFEPRLRITLTPLVIAAAREVLVLVSGAKKAEAVGAVFAQHGSIDEIPARLLREATWFMDEPAAKHIARPESVEFIRESAGGK